MLLSRYDGISNGEQGQIASTRMYLETPVGTYMDSQVAQVGCTLIHLFCNTHSGSTLIRLVKLCSCAHLHIVTNETIATKEGAFADRTCPFYLHDRMFTVMTFGCNNLLAVTPQPSHGKILATTDGPHLCGSP